jgi:hypothetical protein
MGVACRILLSIPATFLRTWSSLFQSIVHPVLHAITLTPIHHSGRVALNLRINDIETIPPKILKELGIEPN